MTENEARVKLCCGGAGCGYVNPTDGIRYCTGTDCMAWRWAESGFHCTTVQHPRPSLVPPHWTFDPGSAEKGEPSGWAEPRQGYCGLVGAP